MNNHHMVPDKQKAPVWKRVSLTKGNQRFSFLYQVGEEEIVVECLLQMVKSRFLDFDMFNAESVAFELGVNLRQTLADNTRAY